VGKRGVTLDVQKREEKRNAMTVAKPEGEKGKKGGGGVYLPKKKVKLLENFIIAQKKKRKT